ncbi:hypothetical protein THIX_60161 [Thiomonas sp. X19]|nr:hypothetical protein THIX_60161 [Thiomonas sp. X19]
MPVISNNAPTFPKTECFMIYSLVSGDIPRFYCHHVQVVTRASSKLLKLLVYKRDRLTALCY